jgi:hypothetical protein
MKTKEHELEGAVRITLRDGRAFLIRPEPKKLSPLNVKGVISLNLSREEIINAVRKGREHRD